jgi:hypothetical protein
VSASRRRPGRLATARPFGGFTGPVNHTGVARIPPIPSGWICFVPTTKFQYQKVVVLVDRPGKDQVQTSTEDAEYGGQGFLVRRILIDPSEVGNSYFKRARELVVWLQSLAGAG